MDPPNKWSLSDRVIGEVMQRAGSLREQMDCDFARRMAATCSLPTQVRTTRDTFSSSKRVWTDSVVSAAARSQSKKKLQAELFEGFLEKREARRERCRTNQARYRKKQQQYSANLETTVEGLRAEIQELENQRQITAFGIPTEQTIWNIVAEYFRLFRHGYIAPATASESSTREGVLAAGQCHFQREFLQATMTMDVTDGTIFGADALLESWRRFSLCHGDIDLRLERLETGVEGSVVASVKLGFTITENTLNYVYPNLVAVDNPWPPLARRLTNQRLVMNGSVRFGWDSATGRVSSLESKGDLLTPMLTLLGNLEDVAIVFDKALITPEGTFAETEE